MDGSIHQNSQLRPVKNKGISKSPRLFYHLLRCYFFLLAVQEHELIKWLPGVTNIWRVKA